MYLSDEATPTHMTICNFINTYLFDNIENISNDIVKYIIGFELVVYFNLITAIFSIVLGIIYIIIEVSLFISSIGKVKTTPFGFHTNQC